MTANTIFDFIKSDEKRMEIAQNLYKLWDEILGNFAHCLQQEIVIKLKNLLGNQFAEQYKVESGKEDNYYIQVFNYTWTNKGLPIVGFLLDNLKYNNKIGIWINSELEEAKAKKVELINRLKEEKYSPQIAKYGFDLNSSNEYWLLENQAKYDFNESGDFKLLSDNKRQIIADEYVEFLMGLITDFSSLIDEVIGMK
jgi:hypothetical protein